MIFHKKFKIEFGFGMRLRKDGSKILWFDARAGLKEIENYFSALTGGCTVMRTQGTWISPTGQKFVEEGATVFAVVDCCPVGETIVKTVDFIKATLDQEAVAVTITEVQFTIA